MQTAIIFDLNGVLLEKDSARYNQAIIDPAIRAHDIIESGYQALHACYAIKKERGLSLYVLSNSGERTWSMITRHHQELLELFDGVVASCMVGFKKPDERIFHALLDKYAIDPAHSYFIDDDAQHIQTAERLGLSGIHVTPGIHLLSEFQRRKII